MTSTKPLKDVIMSEIALDGLEGITFLDLCLRISVRLQISTPLPTKLRDSVWEFIVSSNDFKFYVLPTPRAILKIFDRPTLDALAHTKVERDQGSRGVVTYRYSPVCMGNGERGSCECYEMRREVSDVRDLDVEAMLERFGQALVIVASQKLRNKVLGLLNDDLTLQMYCILERIGRSRTLGEFSAGPGTLQDILNTEKKVSGSYIMKRLVSRNLITKQEYRLERENISKFIYHLPEFYTEMKSRLQILMENAINYLKSCPNHTAEIRDVRAALMTDQNHASRVTKHPDFKEVTERLDLPYRKVYPDAPREKWQCKNQTERILCLIRLKDPNVETYNLFSKKNEQNDDDDENTNVLDIGNQVFDQSLLRQLHQFLDEKGPEGAKQSDVQQYFGLSRLNGRSLIRTFEKYGLVDTFVVDEGRQRVKRWYLKKFAEERMKQTRPPEPSIPVSSQESAVSISDKSFITLHDDTDEALLNVTDNIAGFESSGVDVDSIEASLTFMRTCPNMKEETSGIRNALTSNVLSHRVSRRCQIILKLIALRKVVSTTILVTSIRVHETRLGYKDNCDKRSCLRLLNRLAVDEYLNIMELRMVIREKVVTYLFACDVNLAPDADEIKSVVDSYKAKQIMRRVYEEEGMKEKAKQVAWETKGEAMDKETKKGLQEFTMAPKFIRMRNLHEFLFYYMYGQAESVTPLDPEEIVKNWNGLHPETDMSDLVSELPPIYSKELDWRAFIAPNQNERPGWGVLAEIILKIPLSIIFTLINFDLRLPELQEMMLHPVKRFYTVAQAPQSVRAILLYHRLYSYSIYSNAVNLAYIGALQFGPRRSPEKDQVFIYVNRKVAVYDTRTSEPSYHKIESKEYPFRLFYLKTLDDLQKFWSDIYIIAHGTKLNHRLASVGQEVLIEQPNSKPELQKCLEARTYEEAVVLDDASIPGDQLGAAGFDSALFTHLKQSWMKGRKEKGMNTKLVLSQGKKKKSMKKYKIPQISAAEAATKRKEMIALRKAGGSKILSESKLRKIQIKTKKRKITHYDEVDKTALKLMNKLRVEWKEEEDQTLLTCKLALLYLNPPVGLSSVFQAVRDVLHFKHPTCVNKTTKACQRRLVYILKLNMSLQPTRSILNFCVEELKQNADIERRYGENFLHNLRQVFPSEGDFNLAVKIHFANLVYLLDNCYKNLATNQFQFKNIVLPDNLTEFESTFNVSWIHRPTYVEDPVNIEGVHTMMVDAIIHSSMCCTKDKTAWNFQLFDIYKNYSDELLRTSIKGLRARQVISANKSVKTKRLFSSAVSGCPFHLSQTYLNQITTKFSYDSFSEAFARMLELGEDVQNNGRYSFKSFDIGSTLLFADLSNREVVQVNIELPRCVMQVEKGTPTEHSTSYERVLTKFHGLIKHFNINESEKDMIDDSDEEISISQKPDETKKRVKFMENETFSFAQAPVERLLKLDYAFYHFFCLLSAIQAKEHPVMSHTFHVNDEKRCSLLSCILSEQDPIEACIRIAASCKDMIKGLVSASKKSSAAKIDTSHKNYQVKEENLQTFFRNFIETQKSTNKSKILKITGKTPKSFDKTPNMLELAHDLNLQSETHVHFWIKLTDNTYKTKLDQTSKLATSKSILSLEKSKKDMLQDNVHRYHEMFNINIGKLSVGLKPDCDATKIEFDNVRVPKGLMFVSKERKEEVLKKIKSSAVWPTHMRNVTELRKALKMHKLVDRERKLAENVLEQIKDAGDMGVRATELAIIFRDTPKKLLQKSLNALVASDFILRTGVRTITYVHWTCANAWLVKSYNLKRLERESIPLASLTEMSSPVPSTSKGLKRPHDELTDDEVEILEGPLLKHPRQDYTSSGFVSDFVDRENIFLVPQPWIRINGTLNRRTLDKWMGSVLLHLLQFPGQYLHDLFNRFNVLTPMQVRKLVEFLVELDCVQLSAKVQTRVSLFSEVEDCGIELATDFDSEFETFVEVRPEAFTKFSIFMGNKKYSTDFI